MGIKSIMHVTGKNDIDEITLRAPENTILDAKNEISPGTFVFEHCVPSKRLGKKTYTRLLDGEMQARGVGVLPSVDIGRRSELSNEVAIDVLVINLSAGGG